MVDDYAGFDALCMTQQLVSFPHPSTKAISSIR